MKGDLASIEKSCHAYADCYTDALRQGTIGVLQVPPAPDATGASGVVLQIAMLVAAVWP